MTNLNILKGYGTCLDGRDKWEGYQVISHKVKNIFDFVDILYYIK